MLFFSKVKFTTAALAALVLISGSVWCCHYLAVVQAEEPNLTAAQENKANPAVSGKHAGHPDNGGVNADPSAIQPAGAPDAPAKKPWTGDPKRKWFNKDIATFLRLPKASDVTALRIGESINKVKMKITAANFPAVLDSMKPLKADAPILTAYHYAPWHHIEFETAEGKFQLQLYLGDLASLRAPDGTLGMVMYVWPKEEPKDQPNAKLPGSKAPLPQLAKNCKGALVATLEEIGFPELGPPGAADYNSKWKVEKVLRGTYPATILLTFRVQTLPESSRETPPTVGKKYILISYDTNADQIAVILEATDENLRHVQELLAP
jgi:hypothetical protein